MKRIKKATLIQLITFVMVLETSAIILWLAWEGGVINKITGTFWPLEESNDLPKLVLEEDNDLPVQDETSPAARLKVQSGTLLPLFDKNELALGDTPQFSGTRIVGEVKNMGRTVSTEATPIVKLYDQQREHVATKKAEWRSPLPLPPLEPSAEALYDIYISDDPTSFDSLQLSFTTESAEDLVSISPEIRDRSIETKELISSGEDQGRNFFQLKGTIVNRSEVSLTDIRAAVWVKDSDNNIIAAEEKSFPQDIITPGYELPLLMNLVPFRPGEMADYRVHITANPI